VFLAYPAQKYLGPHVGLDGSEHPFVGRLFILVPAIALLALVPALRRFCAAALTRGVEPSRRLEVSAVAFVHIWFPFAIFGGIVLWYWLVGGEMALARRLGEQRSVEGELALALTWPGIAFWILSGLAAPIVEELVFRGLLYESWKAEWGWFWSMLATSAVFAFYHPVPLAAFMSSLVYVAMLRRTGSLWGPIMVHAAANIALWAPLMGQFYFRTAGKETGEIALWSFHLVALAVFAIAVPLYVWMARDARLSPDIEEDTAIVRC
jgi:membrane protease YdiL (CAAX protease family)